MYTKKKRDLLNKRKYGTEYTTAAIYMYVQDMSYK